LFTCQLNSTFYKKKELSSAILFGAILCLPTS
jgi:hypothetical protein